VNLVKKLEKYGLEMVQQVEKYMHELSEGPLFNPQVSRLQAKLYLGKLRKQFELSEEVVRLVAKWIDLTY